MVRSAAFGAGVAAATAAAVLAAGACWLPTAGLEGRGGPGANADAGAGGAGGGPVECGDGIASPGEECDGDDLAGAGCKDRGYSGGTLACAKSCKLDTSGCEPCGNGVLGPGEQCDGSDFGGTTCRDLGFAGGEQTCDPTLCLIGGCKDAYLQDFEDNGPPVELEQGGAADWAPSTTGPHGGLRCLQSGAVADLESSTISLLVAYDVDGTFAFWHRESSEPCCDLLHFSIDGVEQDAWSSPTWTLATFPMAPGKHTVVWSYDKDAGVVGGDDAVWIDDIIATNGYLP